MAGSVIVLPCVRIPCHVLDDCDVDRLVERRYAPWSGVELRSVDGSLKFIGTAAVYHSLTDLGPFREQVADTAMTKTLAENPDVRFLYNHDPDSVMARTANGTLALESQHRGLVAKADLNPEDMDVQRLKPKLERGDVSQMSFAFQVIHDDWDMEPEDGGKPIRTLTEVKLFDVSAVTFPAYEDTDGGLVPSRTTMAVAEARGIRTVTMDAAAALDAVRAAEIEERLDESAWDASKAMGACENARDYRSICAGERSVGEPDERQHWALPHHYLGQEANAAGVRAARSRFDQTEGLVNRDAARRHLFETHKLPSDSENSGETGETRENGTTTIVTTSGSTLGSTVGTITITGTSTSTAPEPRSDEPGSRDEESHSLEEAIALRERRIRYLEHLTAGDGGRRS